MRIASVALVLLLAACGSDAAPSHEHAPRPSRTPPPSATAPAASGARNTLLVVIDQLDASPAARAAAPRLDALAHGGVRFEMVSAGHATMVSVGALLSSVSPPGLGADPLHGISPYVWTLADAMRCAHIDSAAFLANGYLSDRFHFARSWTAFTNYPREGRDHGAATVVRDALAWIEAHGRERFFVYVHLVEPHLPLAGAVDDVGSADWLRVHADGWSAADAEALEPVYLERVGRADAALGDLLDGLASRGHADDTLVVVTSTDAPHQDPTLLDEPRPGGGGVVPLVVAGPGVPAATGDMVSALDVAPTILDAMGLPLPRSFEGSSLGPTRARVPEDRRVTPPPYVHTMTRELCGMLDDERPHDCASLPSFEETETRAHDTMARSLCP